MEKNKKSKKIKIIRLNNRRMENNNGNETLNSEESEQIIDQEYNEENEFNLNLFNNELTEGKQSSNNNTNLNFYSHTKVRNDYAEFKGSQQNTTINSIINEKEKALKEVHYSHQGRLVNDTDFKEEIDKDKMKSCSNENLLDCNDVANDSEENIINSQIKGMNYEIIEDIISTGNFIDNKKKAILKLEEIFKNYENNSEIIKIEEKTSPDKRLLQHLEDYVLANKFEYKDVEIEIEKGNEKRRMDEYSGYYGMKNMEYAKILFSLNLLGIQSKFQVKNILYVNNGLSVVKIVFQLAFIKISFTLKKVYTNMHLAIRNYNEMGLTEIYLINESNLKLQNRNEYYTNAIVNLEKNFTNLLINKYDFSNIFKESFTDMYETIKSFTSEIYKDIINVIRNSYDNYTQIMNDVNNNKHKVFDQIRIITKNEYIDFVKKMLILVEDFNNKTFLFLSEVEKEVSKIDNFQLDFLYDLKDIINETKKIFANFNENLFMTIEKGIKTFRYDFDDFIHEMIGNLLYLVNFLANNMNKNEILKSGIDEETRIELTQKLKTMNNIINTIKEYLLKHIDNDYKDEMDDSNENSIKIYSKEKLKQYLDDLEIKSKMIMEEIKNKIAYMEKYVLYADNLDSIEGIKKGIKNIFLNNIYEDVQNKLKQIKPEYLNEKSDLIENKEKLFNILTLINKNIDNEVSELNEHIKTFTQNFLKKRQYHIYNNLNGLRKNFLDSSMENLRGKFEKIINDTILIAVKGVLTYNYDLGIVWLQEVAEQLIPLHKRDERLQSYFYTKYGKFLEAFETFLPNAYSEESIQIYKKYFEIIKTQILFIVRNKINTINYYYFNCSFYQDDFNFISQINDEIEYLISNLENYYNEDYFDMKLATFIYKFTSEELTPINDELFEKFENLRKTCERYTEGVRGGNGDYCWNRRRIFRKWHYISVPHTNNYKKIDNSMNKVEDFIKNETTKLIKEFNDSISIYLNGYVGEIQSLFDDLKNYINIKLNSSEELDSLITNYNTILNNMSAIANKDIDITKENIGFFLNDINRITKDVELKFFENIYLKNFSSYLEYPDEVLYKIINLEDELKLSSEIVERQINYIVNKKIWRVKEENHYFITKTKDFNSKLMKLKMNGENIFDYYKEIRINETLWKILEKYNYTNDYKNEYDYLTEENYVTKISNTIKEYKNIISKFEERINDDWILENCTKVENINNSEDSQTNNEESILEENSEDIKLICYKYKKKSSLNYSEYNFNVVKIRRGIYYIKYLYENLENLFNDFNINILINMSQIK